MSTPVDITHAIALCDAMDATHKTSLQGWHVCQVQTPNVAEQLRYDLTKAGYRARRVGITHVHYAMPLPPVLQESGRRDGVPTNRRNTRAQRVSALATRLNKL